MGISPAAYGNWTLGTGTFSNLQLCLTSDINFVAFIKAEQGLGGASTDVDSVG